MEDYRREPSSLKHKLKSSILFSCCFNTRNNDTVDSLSPSSSTSSSSTKSRLNRSSSTPSWLKSTARELPEIKEKCRNWMSRIGKSTNQRRNSAEIRYDPLSYALNFDEGFGNHDVDAEYPLRNFSTRLPVSPIKDRMSVPVVQRQPVCV